MASTGQYIPNIIIIGAGAAGLACAMKLLENDFENILILEAEQRIGGRIETVPFADNVIDLGAQWCHGQRGNVVYELAAQHNVLKTSGNIFITFQCIRSNGEVVPEALVQRMKDIVAGVFRAAKMIKPTESQGSLGEYLRHGFNAALNSVENDDIDKDTAAEFFENYKKVERSESPTRVDEMSACGLTEYWDCGRDYLLNWLDKGYVEFLRLLTRAENFDSELLKDLVVYGTLVDRIEWKNPNGKIRISCSSTQQVFLADHVIVTCSLGVLKQCHEELFKPSLPPWKKSAIQAVSFGNVCKIFLEFPEQFWSTDWPGFVTLWRSEDCDELRKSSRAWLEDLFGFFCVSYQPRVLLGWVVGSHVAAVEGLTDETLKNDCLYLLRRFLPDRQIPEPLSVVRTKWQSNPNFRGAYSFRSIETELQNTGAVELATPLNVPKTDANEADTKPAVLFAGEATSEHHFSTVHGAVESGWREAQRLIDYYSGQSTAH